MANALIDNVSNRIEEMKKTSGLETPMNYSVGNALQSAYLKLHDTTDKYGRNVFESCTAPSIAQALLNMVIQGLTPAKNQCYFIPYGNKLTMQPSYFGHVAALKRLDSISNVDAEVIFKNDEFETGSDENFKLVVKKFNPKFENRDKPIAGAFAVITDSQGNKSYTVMTIKEIQQSWSKTRMNKNDVQTDFGQEMAKRTVLNRAAKFYVNTSDDSDLLAGSINQSTADEYRKDEAKDVTPVKNDSKIERIIEKRKEKQNKSKEKETIKQSNSDVSSDSPKDAQKKSKNKKAQSPEDLIKDFEKSDNAKETKNEDKKPTKRNDNEVEPASTSVADKGVEKSNAENEQTTSEQESLGLDFNSNER